MPCPSQYSRFNHPDYIRWTVQTMKFLNRHTYQSNWRNVGTAIIIGNNVMISLCVFFYYLLLIYSFSYWVKVKPECKVIKIKSGANKNPNFQIQVTTRTQEPRAWVHLRRWPIALPSFDDLLDEVFLSSKVNAKRSARSSWFHLIITLIISRQV